MTEVKLIEEYTVHRITYEFNATAVCKVDDDGPWGLTRITFIDHTELCVGIPKTAVKRKISAARKKGQP